MKPSQWRVIVSITVRALLLLADLYGYRLSHL